MRVRLGCTDGNTYESDYIDEVELQAHLDDVDGDIGTGDFEGTRDMVFRTVDEFVEFLTHLLTGKVNGMKTTDVSIEINGQERKFLFDKIVWSEIERD